MTDRLAGSGSASSHVASAAGVRARVLAFPLKGSIICETMHVVHSLSVPALGQCKLCFSVPRLWVYSPGGFHVMCIIRRTYSVGWKNCVDSVDKSDLHYTLYAFEPFHTPSDESLIGPAIYVIVTVHFNTSTVVLHSGISFSGALFNLVFHVIIICVCNQFSTQYLQILRNFLQCVLSMQEYSTRTPFVATTQKYNNK